MNRLKDFSFLLVPFLVILVYCNSFKGNFVFDDIKLVRDNQWLGSWTEVLNAFNIFSDKWEKKTVRINYRPVRFLSYAIDFHISKFFWPHDKGVRPVVFHVHNVLLHALNCLLLFFLFKSIFGVSAIFSVFLSLLWGLHPVQTESVAYISGRRDVLFTAFYLGALLLYVKGNGKLPRLILIALLYILALFTKEMAVTLPAVLLLMDIFLKRKWNRNMFFGHIILWSICSLYIGFKLCVKNPGGGAPYWGGDIVSALLTEARALFLYAWIFFFPFNLSVDWSYGAIIPSSGLFSPWITLPAVLAAMALICCPVYFFFKQRKSFAFGICLFLVTLSPVMQFFPHPERFAERYLYLPSLGLLIVLYPALKILRPFKTGMILGTLLLVILAGRTIRRNDDWKNRNSLWKSAVAANPECARAHFAYGVILSEKHNWTQAKKQFDYVFSILKEKTSVTPLEKGYMLQAKSFRAQALSKQAEEKQQEMAAYPEGAPERERLKQQVRSLYKKAAGDYGNLLGQRDVDGVEIAKDPRQAAIYFNLASIFFALQEYNKAEEKYKALLLLAPKGPFALSAHFWIGMISIATGKVTAGKNIILLAAEGAKKLQQQATDPKEKERYRRAGLSFKAQLAGILFKLGEFKQALILYDNLLPQVNEKEKIPFEYKKAQIFDRLGKRSEALYILRQLLVEDPGLLPVKLTLADIEIKEGSWKKAKEDLAKIKQEHGPIPAVVALEKQIKIQEVLAQKGGATLVKHKLDAKILLKAGRANMEAGDYDNATADFKDAYLAAESADNKERALISLRYLAKSLRGGGHFQQALSVLNQALRQSPGDCRFLKDLGKLLASKAADETIFQEAVVTFRELDKNAKDSLTRIEALLDLGELYYKKNQVEEALGCYERAASSGTLPFDIHFRMGEIWEELNNTEKAVKAYRYCVETAPDLELRKSAEKKLKKLENKTNRPEAETVEGDVKKK